MTLGASLEIIFGPPGTGKTTALQERVRQYAESEGAETLLLCAFTKTAATELASRLQGAGIREDQVGTLHSLCYQALGCPPIAEAFLDQWNADVPFYQLSANDGHRDWNAFHETPGDQHLAAMNLYRHTMTPRHGWPEHLQAFARLWDDWKEQYHRMDFTDLLENAYLHIPVAPGYPQSLLVDEAQDLSLLQWAVLQSWGEQAKRLIAAGDDDQCLYAWAGADVTPMLRAPEKTILHQSYRVPRRIQDVAIRYSRLIRTREPKIWYARAEDGVCVRTGEGQWRHPESWIPFLYDTLDVPFGDVVFLAPCAYMLTPLLRLLRDEGIPFYNPWRRKETTWNPLGTDSTGKSPHITQRLSAFLRPHDRLWTWHELSLWIPMLRQETLQDGAKAFVTLQAEEHGVCNEDALGRILVPSQQGNAIHGGLLWLQRVVMQSYVNTLRYPLRVLTKYGEAALRETPRVIVSTTHASKGGEGDTVVFFLDLSGSQRYARLRNRREQDNIYRTLYVGCTRAKETLYLVGDGTI